jgi:ABC-type nitrate/sulfonate/bicarbonate transport system substrate-binding protein
MTIMSFMSDPVNGRPIRVGYVPLLDAAPLIMASELGLFARHGLRVELSRELGWANIREKLLLGELEAGHCVASVLPLTAARERRPERRLVTAVSLGRGCNAFTVSKALWDAGVRDLPSLAEEARRRRSVRPLRLAHVMNGGTHHLLLAYWLSAGGLDPDADVRLVTVPPPQTVRLLESGHLDGYCVGEPWNQAACRAGAGFPLAATAEIYPGHPEKVLAVREGWSTANPHSHWVLVRGVVEAARWCDEAANRPRLAKVLSSPAWMGVDADRLLSSLEGRWKTPFAAKSVEGFAVFHGGGEANLPRRSQMMWLTTQLVRRRLLPAETDHRALADAVCRPELLREWTADMNVALPGTDLRTERCFDGRELDPLRPARFVH